MPVSDEQIEDIDGLRSEIEAELPAMIMERLDSQVLVGTGTAPQLKGFLYAGRTGVNAQAKSTDSVPDAIHKGLTKNQIVGFAEPDAVVMHPTDWQEIRLLTTSDGIYIFGPPSERGEKRIWSLPVVTTTYETEGTALLGAFRRYSRLVIKRGIDVQITNSHASYFVQGVQALRADMRVTLAVPREAGFTKVTGIQR